MKIIELKCPNCGASLNISNDVDRCFCTYCGSPIVLYDKTTIKEKTKRHVADTKVNIQSIKSDENKYKAELDYKKNTFINKIIILIVVFVIILDGFIFGGAYINHLKKVNELKKLETEVVELINEGNYDLAKIKLTQMVLDDRWSSDERDSWKTKKDEYSKLIELKESEQND